VVIVVSEQIRVSQPNPTPKTGDDRLGVLQQSWGAQPMPSDALAVLTRLQEQEERAVEVMEEHQRQLATLQALLEDTKRRGKPAGGIEAQIQAAEGEIVWAEQEIAVLREKIVAAEQALPADLQDDDEA
jgi:hypothetical protein